MTIYEYLVLIWELVYYKKVISLIEADILWNWLEAFLNNIVIQNNINLDSANCFLYSAKVERPLPEDYIRQELLYGSNYVSQEYLDKAKIDSDKQAIKAPSIVILRKQ